MGSPDHENTPDPSFGLPGKRPPGLPPEPLAAGDEVRIFDHDWRHYTGFQVVYHPRHMTARELEEGYWRANRKYYSPLSMLKRFHRAPYALNMLIFNLYFAWAVRRRFQPLNYFF